MVTGANDGKVDDMLKNQKILMTGTTGQVGESLALGLAPHNEVWGLARYSKSGSRETLGTLILNQPARDNSVVRASSSCSEARTVRSGFAPL